MATPSVIRLLPGGQPVGTPTEGPTGGRSLVEIYGDGFRLPPTPPTTGPSAPPSAGVVVADSPVTVSVTFGGVPAVDVKVIRSNLLRVTSPISPLPITEPDWGAGAVDVTITNLDDNGDPIPGESVTVAGGWTYRRPKLDATNDSDLVRMVRKFIMDWKLQVLPETVFTTHTDWDRDTSTAYVEVAQMPALVVALTSLPENRFYSCNEGAEERVTDERVEQRRRVRTVDLQFDVIGITDNVMEMLNLMTAAADYIERNPVLEMDGVKFELDYQPGGDFDVATRPSKSNIHSFNGSVVIRGVGFEGLAGFAGDRIVGLTRTLKDAVNLDVEPIAG